jgi:soluble lytic murein transglycosylase
VEGKKEIDNINHKKRFLKLYSFTFFSILVLFISIAFIHFILSDLFFPDEYREVVKKYSTEFRLDPFLVSAIIYTESRYSPAALSSKGAKGLMQILPSTAEQVKRKLKMDKNIIVDLKNPDINIRFGCYYFRSLLDKYQNDIPQALAAYNAGGRNVERWKEVSGEDDFITALNDHGYMETKKYVENVLKISKILRNLNKIKAL